MIMDSVEFMNILKGRRVKLTLKSSSFFGVVQRINQDKTVILADEILSTQWWWSKAVALSSQGSARLSDKAITKGFDAEVCDTILGCTRKRFALSDHLVSATLLQGDRFEEYHKAFPAVGLSCTLKAYPVLNGSKLKTGLCLLYTKDELKSCCVCRSDGCKLPGTQMFYGFDILNDEDEDINFVVIDEFHEKFGPAVMHIKKQRVIGVGAEGIEIFRHGRLCWLQIATKNKVYLFDILLLGARAFKNGLSMILESKHILKVIHDCRAIAGCLTAQFGVKLTHVFDTQVADVMCFYSETGGFLPDRVSSLKEVVRLHLRVSSSQLSSLEMKSQLTKDEKEIWYKRPCPVPFLKVMARSVIHLQSLRLVLLDSFMTDFMNLVDCYLSSSNCEPDDLRHLDMESLLELPKELRQLEEMRCERQEGAMSHYPITEQGLLARFSPKHQASSQASPAGVESQAQTSEITAVESPSSPQMGILVRRNESDLCTLTEADITVGEDIVKALKAATLVMSEENTPTLSIIAPLHAQMLEEMSSVPQDFCCD
ncbi:piRNA biogenesis protein EXD1 [Pholidichthys leucotaenia]